MRSISTTSLLIVTVVLVFSSSGTYAFGAGDIPNFSFLNDKAFRHGDIESILENLAKQAGLGGGLLGLASSVISPTSGGPKFSKMDVKRVYFGNWLRDYSQAMDIAGLSKLSADTIALIISVLGFMTFGYATREFEITQERLGVYLPVEHIDNPKGYAEVEGDARSTHPKLRPPVEDRELEIDEQTGMKKYMASENEGFDTSTACIRRTLKACIECGRRARGKECADLFEAFRLLGTGLHTLEDLLAHSNWCEIALRKMGYEEVFCHVGDNVILDTPNGPAPPLVTGTFGGADFLHSLLGEAQDHLSQASVTNLAAKMNEASKGGDSNFKAFEAIIDTRAIEGLFEAIEKIPGLSDLVEEFTNTLNTFVYTVLGPYLTPIVTSVVGVLSEGSKAVIDNEDEYRVFDDPDTSDPSHSILSKDHFGLILNEPAGKIAQIVVQYTVGLIVNAWSDDSDPDRILDVILEAFHHPYYATGESQIQHLMFESMERWIGGLGSEDSREVLQRLSKESVRQNKNKRIGLEDMDIKESGYNFKTQNCFQGDQSDRGAYVGEGGGGSLSEDQSWLQDSSYAQEQNTHRYGRQESDFDRSMHHEDSSYVEYQQESSQYNTDYFQESYGSRSEDDVYSRESYYSLGDTGPEDIEEYERTEDHDRSSYRGPSREEGDYDRSDEYTHRNEGYNPSYEQQMKYDSCQRDDGLGEEYNIQRENHEVYGGSEEYGYSSRKSSSNRYEDYGQNEDYSSDRPEFYGEQSYGSRSGYHLNDSEGETHDDGDEYREDKY